MDASRRPPDNPHARGPAVSPQLPPLPTQTAIPMAAPVPLEYLTPGGMRPQGWYWVEGNLLVARNGASIDTHRCIRCNTPSDGRPLERRLSWHHPALFAIILIGILIYAIVALIVQAKGTVFVGLCSKCRARRRNSILLAWLLMIGAIVVPIVLGQYVSKNSPMILVLVVAGFGTFVFGAIWGVVRSRVITPSRIDKRGVLYLKGASHEFLAMLGSGA